MYSYELLTSVWYWIYFLELKIVMYNWSCPFYLMFKEHTYLGSIQVTSEDLQKEAKIILIK